MKIISNWDPEELAKEVADAVKGRTPAEYQLHFSTACPTDFRIIYSVMIEWK